ncbi:MAG TPA: STAS domain-containing protein [Dyella sp.]|uniref:STAS domain-containing protein n=1 Tax=Dyella sp. TaxID=1869338 RepID=UPI002CAE2BE5|nr:STAS domain-containing protein [Dyella sp.]HTV85397.1 STAS domain-containing protein [Dyella sp.]
MGSKSKPEATVSSEARIGIPADCRIADVGDLHRKLSDAFDAPQIVLDASAVERVDTAALQLLVVFQREAAKRGKQMSWAGVSAPLHEAASQLGLAQTLALPAKQPA